MTNVHGTSRVLCHRRVTPPVSRSPGTEVDDVRIRQRRFPGSTGGRLIPRGDQGSISLFLIILLPALLCLAGLVIDGGTKLRAAENAISIAQEAARAGAGMVDRSTAYATGRFVVDQAQAIAAARAYLAAAGTPGTVTAAGPNAIRVTVTITEQPAVLSLIGVGPMTSTGQATANLVTGVTGPGR